MKIVFISLLVANVALVIYINLFSDDPVNHDRPSLVAPEKIILLPKQVSCLKWGEFEETTIQQVKVAALELAIPQTINIELSGKSMLFWVYIPPLDSQLDADREINKLRNLGIVSYRVQEEGKWQNAISLAILSDQSLAEKFVNEMKIKGIDSVAIKPKTSSLNTIVIYEPDVAATKKITKLAQQFAGSKLIQATCDRI